MMPCMSTAVAREAHQIPDRSPIQLAIGDQVRVGERDTQCPEFALVTASHGTGWVPARHLSADSGPAIVTTPYDTTELPTQPGDVLEVLKEDVQSGWLWCRADDGREGRVPLNTLDRPGANR
jgi:hypothetical protein